MASFIRSSKPLCSTVLSNLWKAQNLNEKIGRKFSTSATCNMVFRQLFDSKSWTYTYLLADDESKEAVVIDPVLDLVDRDINIVKELGLTLKYGINTHVHADHITGTGVMKKRIDGFKSVLSEKSGAKADLFLADGEKLNFGKYEIEGRCTPGHTNGCMSFVIHSEKLVFTGDAVLIRGCGRTDFQQGDPRLLYNSVKSKIFSLPDDFLLYPAHDYLGMTSSSVGEEKKHNKRLTKSIDQFEEIMNNLKLPYPKQIDTALPANLVCGIQDDVA
ncbi:unnamed protein product [Owenia fusiformis]|uniref:Persulfide dioxygenase ETHE1, mitochondrial n=1 Tax=Owenia fusiformis TaxID=6347 RepID=A0A8J1XUP9_OWEFU|nr:unnamed protein product [Owenia fusiformis]